MKRIIVPVLLLLGNVCRGQDIDTAMLSKLKLNFVVPDMPAFKALNTDPSKLLRPSTVQALAVNMSSFGKNGKLIIPETFALELSPALLLNANKGPQALQYYADNAVMNSFRVSIGSSSDTTFTPGGRSLAAGFRISIINKGDPTTDKEFHSKIVPLLRELRTVHAQEARKDFAAIKGYKGGDLDSFIYVHIREFQDYYEKNNDIQSFFSKEMKKLKEEYRKEHWNDEKLDLAIAITGFSKDSLIKNARFSNAQLWFTWATPLGRNNKAQLLLGFNSRIYKDLRDTNKVTGDKTYSEIVLPLRLLVGTNRVKGFTELQYAYISDRSVNKLYAMLGAELNITDGLWINLSGGIDYNSLDKAASFVPQMNIKLSLPENFKFF